MRVLGRCLPKKVDKMKPSKEQDEDAVNENPVLAEDEEEEEETESTDSKTVKSEKNWIYVTKEDRGSQAWCIVFCCFFVNMVSLGFLKCLGILIIELQRAYHASPSDVSILVSITNSLNCIAGPLACYLVLKCTARALAFVGTLLVSLGLMISWFATSIEFLYLSIGVLVGAGSGLSYSPGLILVGTYFQGSDSRGMANGIIVSGSPLGGMVMPYMINFLVKYLECRGTLLILGGIMLNAVVCTLSFKPYKPPEMVKRVIPSFHESTEPRKTTGLVHIPLPDSGDTPSRATSLDEEHQEDVSEDSSGPEFWPVEEGRRGKSKSKSQLPLQPSSGSVIVYRINERYGRPKGNAPRVQPHPQRIASKPPYWFRQAAGESPNVRSVRTTTDQGRKIGNKESETELRKQGKDVPHPAKLMKGKQKGSGSIGSNRKLVVPSTKSGIASSGEASSIREQGASSVGSQTIVTGSSNDTTVRHRRPRKDETHKNKELATPPSGSRKLPPYILSLDHSCVVMWSKDNIAQEERLHSARSGEAKLHLGEGEESTDAEDNLMEKRDNISPSSRCRIEPIEKKNCCARCVSFLWNSPLRSSIFLILLLSNASTAVATTNILLLIPSMAQHRGLSKTETSTIYLIISLSDLCSRLIGAFIYDKKWLSAKTIFAYGLCSAGISGLLIGFADSFLKMACFGALFGFSCGFHIGIFGALLIDVVGIDALPMGYACCMIVNGILQFIFINVSGAVLSRNPDAYKTLYIFYGVALMVGGSLWVFPFLLRKLQCLRRRRLFMRSPPVHESENRISDKYQIESSAVSNKVKEDNAKEEGTLHNLGAQMSNIT